MHIEILNSIELAILLNLKFLCYRYISKLGRRTRPKLSPEFAA
jgi:hypothetical protein